VANFLLENARRLFGFEFLRQHDAEKEPPFSPKPSGTKLSPVPPDNQEGALNVQYGGGGGYYGYYLDLDGTVVDDFQLINRYREMQLVPEVDEAIDQIINEMVIQDNGRMPVSINTDNVADLDDVTKIRLQAEFDGLLKQMHFHKDAYSVVRQWYVDGRLFYHLVVDEQNPSDGIQELRIIDPRCIRKIREVVRKRHQETQMDLIEVQREYYAFNPMGFAQPTMGVQNGNQAAINQFNGAKLTKDAVAFCPSGMYDSTKRTVLSWMHKAIKPLNLMRMMEDSCVIYRVSRAPERRVFYIDVGNLPKAKAEQYLYDIMQKYRNKLVYDVATGDIRDDRKFMSIMEDFWLPRRENGKGTEITTLPAGQNLSEMEDVEYFKRKLYRALNLPPSRFADPSSGLNLGRASEISRDELRFIKFVHRMQSQFNVLFDQLLERQCRLKNVLTEQEWNRIKDSIRYTWQLDSYFEELKGQEMWTSRMNLLGMMEPYINKFFSSRWIIRNILHFTDDEWEAIREEFDDDPAVFSGADAGVEGDDGMQGEVDDEGNPIDPLDDGDENAAGDSMGVTDDDADQILKDTDSSAKPAPKKAPFGSKPKPKGGSKPPFGNKA
jgi:hypothetical protein